MFFKNGLSAEEVRVEFSRADMEKGPVPKRLFSKIAFFPRMVLKRFKNTYLLIRHGELREPASRNVCPMRLLNTFPTLFFTMKLFATPSVMKAALKDYRKDKAEGLFDDSENARVFMPLLRDLYPEEKVCENDFLMTCSKEFVQFYRQPILQFIGPQNIKKHGLELEKIVEDTMIFWEEKSGQGKVNATELSQIFTTTVISRLLLGHPGPFEVYREIAYAIDFTNKFMMKKAWRHPISKEEKQKYQDSLEIVRKGIAVSLTTEEKPLLGSLVDTLREEKKMSELQIKTTLLLMYLGGSETTASLLNYLLWQLGQHPECQEEIFDEIKEKNGTLFEIATTSLSIDRLFAESIRLFTPAYVIGRQPAADLVCTVKNKEGDVLLREKIAKKEVLLSAPTFAARDPSQFEDPNAFNPARFEGFSKTFSWLPFGDGKHTCPGQWLAKAEVVVLIALLVKKFRVASFPANEVKQRGYMTLKPGEDVWLLLEKRNKSE